MSGERYKIQTGIYKIENMINHKVYIGQSTDIHKRWINHKSALNQNRIDSHLYRSMKKFGVNNFKFSIIEVCTKDELNEKEMFWINHYKSYNSEFGYNLTPGGDNNGIKTRKLTDEQVREIYALLPYKSQTEIAKVYNLDQSEVSRINDGKVYHFGDVNYPICSHEYYIDKITRRKEKYYCKDCGKEIYYSAIRCMTCNGKYKTAQRLKNKKYPSRDELKDMIRNMPFVKIGAMYGVTDNAIKKWCVNLNLPSKKSIIKSYTNEQWDTI